MREKISHLTDEQISQCFPESGTVSDLAVTGASIGWMVAFGAMVMVLGVVLVLRNRKKFEDLENGVTMNSMVTAVALMAAGGLGVVSSGEALTIEPGLPEFCYIEPTLDVSKNERGDDRTEVESGIHDITVTIKNTSQEALSEFRYVDETVSGKDAVFSAQSEKDLNELTLQPDEEFIFVGTVEVGEDETHYNNISVSAQGESSQKIAIDNDRTTLIGPLGPVPEEPIEPKEPEKSELNMVLADKPDVVRQCDAEPAVTLPPTEGIDYDTDRDGGELLVTASAEEGYGIVEGSKTEWYIDMSYDTSEWDEDSWNLEDPQGWVLRHMRDGGQTRAAILPLNVEYESQWQHFEEGDFSSWIDDAMGLGAGVTVGEPEVALGELKYDTELKEYRYEWEVVDHQEVPDFSIMEELGISYFGTELSDFVWDVSETSVEADSTRFTWPVTVSLESGLCTQSKTIDVDTYTTQAPL